MSELQASLRRHVHRMEVSFLRPWQRRDDVCHHRKSVAELKTDTTAGRMIYLKFFPALISLAVVYVGINNIMETSEAGRAALGHRLPFQGGGMGR